MNLAQTAALCADASNLLTAAQSDAAASEASSSAVVAVPGVQAGEGAASDPAGDGAGGARLAD